MPKLKHAKIQQVVNKIKQKPILLTTYMVQKELNAIKAASLHCRAVTSQAPSFRRQCIFPYQDSRRVFRSDHTLHHR